MKITFDRAGVDRLIAHAMAAPEHSPSYGQKPPIKPGLFLIGDQGVYLMSNGKPGLKADKSRGNFVIYADQINPETMPFDDWWEAKRSAFGGDDGADTIDIDAIELILANSRPGAKLTVELTPDSMTLLADI
jgi:Protein of unknown function (DUF3085)